MMEGSTDEQPQSSTNNSFNASDHVIVIITVIVASINLALFVALMVYLCTRRQSVKEVTSSTYTVSGTCREKEVLETFYDKLATILPVGSIPFKLVSAKVISMDDLDEIELKQKPKHKAAFILNKIHCSLKAGIKHSFYMLLDIMEQYDSDIKVLAKDMRRGLLTVLISSCPHCEQLYDQLTCFAIKKLHTDIGADINSLRTSLDQGTPLITCSCSECQVPELLKSSFTHNSRNILQLQHQTDSSNSLQSNGSVKVLHGDMDNGMPVREVLDWLDSKLPLPLQTKSMQMPMPESTV